ncbi:MAG: trypsin-like peptidase domain-containing protein [Terrimicrobiaceae bacterium]|nr:trypsin-like peptidase domain-containing protein [Terrimicrobiaceae bacterium]
MFRLILAFVLVATPVFAQTAPVARSVVRIEAASEEPNYRAPWNPGSVAGGVGAGFVISGNRILTNAHVVSNSRFLTVSKEGNPHPFPARVLHVAHDADLAMLTVDDPGFFKGSAPLELGGIPELESTVSVYGYPIGGQRLSVTRGIVSRIDFQTYSHSGMDAHLTIQIDAAINPGNSGGPVLQNGKVVGVAFQGYSGDVAQNVGYMIPTPVVRRFLRDVEDGKYDRYVDLSLSYHSLFNPAARRALGVPDADHGVLVGAVYPGGSSEGLVQTGDVLLEIDGLPIASDGTIEMDGKSVELAEVVERKFKGDDVRLKVLRNREVIDVVVPALRPWPFLLHSNTYDDKPRYVIFGGLVFQPVDQNFMSAFDPDDLRLRYAFDFFVDDQIFRERPEIVVLSGILADPINAYAGDFRMGIVDEVNDRKIRTLDDVAAAFAEPADHYVIRMEGPGRPIVLERKAVEEARARILTRYGITREQNLSK